MIVQPIYFLMLFVCTGLTAMDFNDGMTHIHSYQDVCSMYEQARLAHDTTFVAYRVDRRSTFYCRCNPILDEHEQRLMSSDWHVYPRVHYALLQKSWYEDLPPSRFSYTYFQFTPILIKGQPIPRHEIVSSLAIAARRNSSCFTFAPEHDYFEEKQFLPGAYYFPKKENINVLKARDNLRIRAITGFDALLLLKWFEQQKISVGWQDHMLVNVLKKKFEEDFGFCYESRQTIIQKIN